MKQRPHAELIKAWAEGCEIQYRNIIGDWADCPDPQWARDCEYRIKPVEPEKKYPVTALPEDTIISAWYGGAGVYGPQAETFAMFRVANAALRHACDNGQVVTREEFDRAIGERKARDMAVAEAVRCACQHKAVLNGAPCTEDDIIKLDLAAIIAEVKP